MAQGIDLRLLFTSFGAVVFLNEDDSVASTLGHAALTRMAAGG